MANILAHPNSNKDLSAEKFEAEDGIVIIKSKRGPLTLERSLYLLEMAKSEIIALARGL